MKLITYQYEGATAIGAVVNEQTVVPLSAVAGEMLSLINLGEAGLAEAGKIAAEGAGSLPLDEVTLLAPLPNPRRNIMCLGRNYAAHAEESHRALGSKVELPQVPIIFTKATTAVNGPFDEIPYNAEVSASIDYEAELALIIGRDGRDISRADALDYVYGYAVLNDVSARDLQHAHKQFFKGKSLDGSAPFGPWIVTADEIPDPQSLQITCTVNGILKQSGNTSQMIFDIAETIVQLSKGMTLLAGDIIATGTPSGVGFARTPPEFLRPGDVVMCAVEGVGAICNRIAA